MYCKACGNPLKEGDYFCTQCGAKVTDTEFQWNVHEFTEPKKTEDIHFDWNISDAEEDAGIDADLFRELAEGGTTGNIEDVARFFTFQKKNEEFQKLLDRELERINKNYVPPGLPVERMIPREDEKDLTEPAELAEAELAEAELAEPVESTELTEIQTTEQSYEEIKEEEKTLPPPLWFEQEEEEPKKKEKKGRGVKIALILVILLILVEIGALATRYYWPESQAAKVITGTQEQIVEIFTDWKDRVVEFFQSLGSEGDAEETIPPEEQPEDPTTSENPEENPDGTVGQEPSPTPVADKTILIKAVAEANNNIETIRANDALTLANGQTDEVKELDKTTPINNNIWIETEQDGVKYYDQEIVSTLISFDSRWIDYVNQSDKAVLDLLKAGSRAYQRVSTYSKVGKVEQNFVLLEIGEIRQGDQGFYVWTYEEIEEMQGGKKTLKQYHWIYYLEPVEGEIKIADYYSYGA